MKIRTGLKVLILLSSAAAASTLWAAGNRPRRPAGEDVTIVGKLVDLQSHMTGKPAGADAVKVSQKCIRSGVPAALETEDGLIVVGMGENGPSKLLVPLVLQNVELKGTLYEKDELQYIDITSARAVREELAEEEHADTEHEETIELVEEEEAPETEPVEEEP